MSGFNVPNAQKSLLAELTAEQQKSARLQEELERLRASQGQMQRTLEQEEEAITNKMLRRLDLIRTEKERLARSVEQEEEYISNTLIKKLDEVRREKVTLQAQLEREEEYIVNQVRRSVEHQRSSSFPSRETTDLRKKVESMQVLIVRLKAKLMTMEGKCREVMEQNVKLEAAMAGLRKENFKLAGRSPPLFASIPPLLPPLPPDLSLRSTQGQMASISSTTSGLEGRSTSLLAQSLDSDKLTKPTPIAESVPLNRPFTTPGALSSLEGTPALGAAAAASAVVVTSSDQMPTSTKENRITVGRRGRSRASSEADLLRFAVPRAQLMSVIAQPTPPGHPVTSVKPLLSGKLFTKLETENEEEALLECQFSILSSGHLSMHPLNIIKAGTPVRDIVIELHCLVGISEVDPTTVKLKCKKDSSPARLLQFSKPEEAHQCVTLLRDWVSLSTKQIRHPVASRT